MPSLRVRSQNAQSLVEFALVLPIFLLIVLGIFTFGHLFFTYTQVVAASREAARFGSAVGLTTAFVQSYRDCDGIRESAFNIGRFAGVTPTEASVQIEYDQGPRKDGSAPVVYAHGCPEGGIGPGYIELGDRIVVTVTVMYRSITPLIDIGEFPITATTRRTIVLAMPVGESTPAISGCSRTITRVRVPSYDEGAQGSYSLVGQAVVFDLEVIPDTPGDVAPGTVKLFVDKTYTDTADCTGSPPFVSCSAQATFTWDEVGEHMLRAEYVSSAPEGNTPCFLDSRAEPIVHRVMPADTTTEVLPYQRDAEAEVDEIWLQTEGDPLILMSAVVRPLPPAGGVPEGTIIISNEHGDSCETMPIEQYNGEFAAWGSCALPFTHLGLNRITATFVPTVYVDKVYFNPSSGFRDMNVVYEPGTEPTLIPTNTATPTSTPTPKPESTIDPKLCPVVVAGTNSVIDFNTSASSMLITLNNPANIAIDLASIQVDWPLSNPQRGIIGINVGPVPLGACASNNTCQWPNTPLAPNPPSLIFNPTMVAWNSTNTTLTANAENQIRVDFNDAILTGNYKIVVKFATDQLITCNEISVEQTKPGP